MNFWLKLLPVAIVFAFLFCLCADANAMPGNNPGMKKQARPNPAPARPRSFDELVNEYNRLKAAGARNTDLGRLISYASSFNEPRVVEWLKNIYQNEKDAYIKQRTLSTLGSKAKKNPELIGWLKNIFVTEKDPNNKRNIISAMGNARSKEAADALLDIYRQVGKKADASLRRSIMQALGNVAEHLPFDVLVDLLKDAGSGYERSNIARAIAKIGTRDALTALIDNIDLDKGPGNSNLNERYRISTILKEAARDCEKDETISWLVDKVVPDKKTPEAARVAIIKGFTERSRRYIAAKEAEERRRREEEERKKAEEAARNNPNASPPPPQPRRGISSREPAKPIPAEKLVGLLDDRSEKVRASAAEFLGECPDGSVVSALISHLNEKDKDTLIKIIFALGRLRASEAVEPLMALLKKGKWEIKAAVIDALGRIGDPSVISTMKKYLNDRQWQVRAAAIDALSRIKSKEAVTLLIERMKKEDGRLLGDIARALQKLTGLELGTDARAWEDWWKVAKDRYVLPEEVTNSPETANPGISGGPKTELTPTYHGIEVISHKICFIIDISGSMSSQMRNQGQGGQGQPQPGSPVTSDPNKKKDKKEPIFKGKKGKVKPKDNSKMEFAKAELINCVIALNPKVRFNMISFESKVNPWQKRLVPASEGNRKQALKWITAMRPTGSTNLGDALLLAFEDKEVDTIFVLSDGSPNSGKLPSPDAILNEVRRINTSRRVIIHTINFAGARDFMKKLAEDNGGQFVDY